jgi:2,5-diketo-D-gluconate reductase A
MSTHTDTTAVPYLELNDGHRIPQLGFGVFQVPPEDTAEVVTHALSTGYRSIDTAAAYENEAGVAEALAQSGIDRGELFITTKLWNRDQGHDSARRAFERSVQQLDQDYVDLYLIHWPAPHQDKYVETWKAFTELQSDGRARSIGVSNFLPEHLERIIDATGVVPALNQIELHPRLQQAELRRWHREHGVVTEAWSPLGQGASLDEAAINEIAARHDRTPAQVVLRWHVQLGNVVIPKSVTPARIEENFRIFDFELSSEEMDALAELEAGERVGPDPATFS